ncbi:unnamed protein product [Candida verbasci]|uniref:aromatic-amino-acid transaminase n=1 Tax=Candida verbasci TaxID=1227364 RepID=A0A9W4TW72_9ASCO|nr:unnamed protein product [Candida verbasci]
MTKTNQGKDLKHLLSTEAASRSNSPLKDAFKYYKAPGMTFLGGGLPLSDYFPFNKISADIPTPSFSNGIGEPITDKNKTTVEVYKNEIDNQKKLQVELARSLQYGYTEGAPELMNFIREHTDMIHKVPYDNWDIIISVGNTESWDSSLRTFCNRGDSILVEEYSFSSALETANGQGINCVPVAMDEYGLLPNKLENLLKNWIGPKPKLLYTIATGQNPTGSSLSSQRRKEIYDIACKYDFIIVEDEPYYFLQMEPYTKDIESRDKKQVHSHSEFLGNLIPSFLLMDQEGRVVRLDSFSKVLAPGLRISWIVGQAPIIERYLRLHEVSIQTASGITQSITNALLQSWGQKGYLDWLIGLRHEYTHKRDVAIDAVEKYFPKQVTSYVPPVAGMFFTVVLDASKHPKFDSEYDQDVLKVENDIYEQGIKQGCLMIPGSWFKSQGQSVPPQKHVPSNPNERTHIFFRGTYAAVPLDELIHGIESFAKAVKIEYGIE